ncbi:hypothetical protein NC653_028105 [Populus alba x Populus x berolinensis]|uniref:Uncharacterized protein n=1 Tax=Populus alba x Populus x berolinensis TaxID=444605 RepID=A0AAD6Q6Z6_9ROSI|nr:hypothetical protein NC653_028105 [Populus alba x Populus x berolinensis]
MFITCFGRSSDDDNYDDSVSKMKAAEEALEAQKKQSSFELSGKLAAETNRVIGITLLFTKPPYAKKPDIRWRLYVFKGGEALNGHFCDFLFLDNPIEPQRYYELFEKDTIKFAFLCTAKALGKLSCIPFSLILKVEDVIFSSLEAYSLNSFNGVYTLLKPLFEYAGLLVQLILAIFLLWIIKYENSIGLNWFVYGCFYALRASISRYNTGDDVTSSNYSANEATISFLQSLQKITASIQEAPMRRQEMPMRRR